MRHRLARRSGAGVVGLALTAALVVAGCQGSTGVATSTMDAGASASLAPTEPGAAASVPPSASPSASSPSGSPSPGSGLPSVSPSPPPGTAFVEVSEAGILLPVPVGWRTLTGTEITDPATRASLAVTYPGAAAFLQAMDQVGGYAKPALLAIDPSAAGKAIPLAANLSVLVAPESVSGPLLGVIAGFICDGLAQVVGATGPASRERVTLPIGEAIRCAYDVPASTGTPILAVAWVIGAPAGTLLVTALGPSSAFGDVGLLAASIVALPSAAP